jgi:hypothetical protein
MPKAQSAETKSRSDGISFFNRDHIVSVTIKDREIIVTTTAGKEIRIPASPATIAKFADPPSYRYGATGELTNDIQSNFVSIDSSAPKNRFVDDGPEFLTVVKSKSE